MMTLKYLKLNPCHWQQVDIYRGSYETAVAPGEVGSTAVSYLAATDAFEEALPHSPPPHSFPIGMMI